MKYFIYIFFILLFFLSSSTEGATDIEMLLAGYAFCVLFFSYPKIFITRVQYTHFLLKKNLMLLGVVFFILIYSLIIAILSGYSFEDYLTNIRGMTPLLLCFPFAFYIRERNQWVQIFTMFIILGIATSLRDLYYYTTIPVTTYVRLTGLEMANIDFFLALFLCLNFVFFYEKRSLFILSVSALPLLILRSLFTGNRGFILLFVIGILAIVMKSIKDKSSKKGSVLPFNVKRFFIGIVILAIFSLIFSHYGAENINEVFELFKYSFKKLDVGVNYRLVELKVIMEIFLNNPFGTGFGSEANFYETIFSGPSATMTKSWVHNLFLFLVWKLGIFGLIIIFWIVIKAIKTASYAWRHDDPLVWTAYTLILIYLLYSMIETLFLRFDLNFLIAVIIGFLLFKKNEYLLRTKEKGTHGKNQKSDLYNDRSGFNSPSGIGN